MMSITARQASSGSAATMTPFPAASPLAFTTRAGKSALLTHFRQLSTATLHRAEACVQTRIPTPAFSASFLLRQFHKLVGENQSSYLYFITSKNHPRDKTSDNYFFPL